MRRTEAVFECTGLRDDRRIGCSCSSVEPPVLRQGSPTDVQMPSLP